MPHKALVIIDIQNDYFPQGKYPQWQPERVVQQVKIAIEKAQKSSWKIVLVQHVSDEGSPLFALNSSGVEIHKDIISVLPNASIVKKKHADSFLDTELNDVLQKEQVTDIYLCGIMTQNCVTHTAISDQARAYQVQVLTDACTAPDAMVHNIALNALADRVTCLATSDMTS